MWLVFAMWLASVCYVARACYVAGQCLLCDLCLLPVHQTLVDNFHHDYPLGTVNQEI